LKFIRIFFVLFFAFSNAVIGQRDYKGRIIDVDTNLPIPYVNIGVLEKGIGTVSDEEGLFHLSLNESKLSYKDSVQFSSMGYQTLKEGVADLEFVYNEYSEILMQPESVELNEVVVTNRGAFEVSDVVGYQNYGENTFGYWKDNIALGGELATKIRIKKGLRKLNTLFFEVFDNPSDSVLVRVNLYDMGKTKSVNGKNLNESNNNILYTIYPTTKLAVVDLTPYSIYVRNDFFVSLELLKVYGDEPIGLVIAASVDKGTYSLRKFASMDKWEVLPLTSMAYHLNTTYFSNSKKANSKVLKAQKSRNNISGFVFTARKPISNVIVTNLSTNEQVYSNEKGRYQILGAKDDILTFEIKGLKKKIVKLLEKNIININMVSE